MYTHTCMRGLYNKCIDYKDIDKFYIWYTKNVNNLHMVERVRYPCKLFIDIDKLDTIDIEPLIKEYPDCDYVICVNETNNGMHVIFQNKIINTPEEAQHYTNSINRDDSVYKTGLRMIGSRKKKENKRYYPFLRIKNGVKYDMDRKVTVENLNLCSILIPHVSIDFPTRMYQMKKNDGIVGSNIQFKINLEMIHERYKEIHVTKVTKLGCMYVLNTTEKWCMNIQKCHNSKTIYFLVRKKVSGITISQKCYCRCSNSSCKDFESETKKLKLGDFKLFAFI